MTETPPGWYPDPSGTPGTRFWDGQAWTDNVQPAAPPSGAPVPPAPAKKKHGKCTWFALGLVALIVISAAAGSSSDKKSSGGDSAKPSSSAPSTNSADSCGSTATDDCTPHVGPNQSVKVDALVWRVSSASTTAQIGDTTYGLGSKADGVYVVVKLRVHSTRDESATLTDSVIKLETEGTTYDPDLDATVASIGSGAEPFFLETLGPDSNKTGTVVFDIPRSKLSNTLELRFGELGFGETHGYIALPELGA